MPLLGVDVSVYQDRASAKKSINWPWAEEFGISFAIIRASDGHRKDIRCLEHLKALEATTIIPGVYQLLRPSDGMKVHQEILRPAMQALSGTLHLPPVVDFELVGQGKGGFSDGVSAKGNLDFLIEWITWIEDEYLVNPILYTGPAFWLSFMKEAKPNSEQLARFASCPLWLADYNNKNPGWVEAPSPWARTDIWQYTAKGVVPGFASSYDAAGPNLDLNLFFGNKQELIDLATHRGTSK